jgi:uncharacterized protein (TIGR02996 family)
MFLIVAIVMLLAVALAAQMADGGSGSNPEEEALIRAILVDLNNEARWVCYANWLQQRSDPRADLIRLHGKLRSRRRTMRPRLARRLAAEWREVLLQGLPCPLAYLRGVKLPDGVNLARRDLRGADLQGSVLFRANLVEAKLQRANLRRARMVQADLRRADLRWACCELTDLYGADLRELSEDTDLTRALTHGARIW